MPKSSKRQKRSRYLVFVSHSSLDAWIARVMVEKIEALGAECWLDEKDLAVVMLSSKILFAVSTLATKL